MKLKKKYLGIFPLAAFLQGCVSLDSINLSNLTEKMTMLFTDNVVSVEPPPRKSLLKYKSIVLKSNVGVRNPTIRALGKELSYSKVGNDKYFDSVGFYPSKSNSNAITLDLNINDPKISKENFREKRFKCPGNKTFNSCDSSEAYHFTVACSRTVAASFGSYRIYDSKNRTIENEEFSFTSEDKTCEDFVSSKKSASELERAVKVKTGVEIAKLYIPKLVERPNDLIEKDENLPEDVNGEMISIFKSASEESIFHAKSRYLALAKSYPDNESIIYNIAYCNHMLGNYREANKQFKEYIENSSNINDDALKYLEESNEWMNRGVDKINRK